MTPFGHRSEILKWSSDAIDRRLIKVGACLPGLSRDLRWPNILLKFDKLAGEIFGALRLKSELKATIEHNSVSQLERLLLKSSLEFRFDLAGLLTLVDDLVQNRRYLIECVITQT